MSFIILDRDGVINFDSKEYIKSPDEWAPIPGSLQAIAQLNRAGYRILVATNQSGVARGYYDLEILSDIHEKFLRELTAVGGYVDEIFFCPHHPDENCLCRKPKPGMLHHIQKKYELNFADTYFIGDSTTDILAAKSVGCKPLLVLTGNGEKVLKNHPEFTDLKSFKDLAAAAEFIISK